MGLSYLAAPFCYPELISTCGECQNGHIKVVRFWPTHIVLSDE